MFYLFDNELQNGEVKVLVCSFEFSNEFKCLNINKNDSIKIFFRDTDLINKA